jgi:hypothetical protein
MIDPVYSFDRYYTDYLENGAQFLIHSGRIRSDTWIDWQNFILPGSTEQEVFSVGSSNQFGLLNPGKRVQLFIPLQVLIYHHGGQINETDQPVSTILNTAEGIGLRYAPGTRFLNSVQWENFVVTYNEIRNGTEPYKNGLGYYTYIILNSRICSFLAGYWNADKYFAPMGEPLFQSVSWKNQGETESHRELVVGKLIFHFKPVKGVELDIRTEGYLDPEVIHIDYSYGLTISINRDFFLLKVNESKKDRGN